DELAASVPQQVRYRYQENQGAYGARNTGLDHVQSTYVAFYDSDDLWLPHHLADCVAALEANPEVDWVYGAGRIVDDQADAVIAESTFYVNGHPRPFLQLPAKRDGQLAIIGGQEALRCQITHGLYCGLQNSVLRRRVFEQLRFEPEQRDEQ